MSNSSFRSGVGLLVILASVVGAYALVLSGITPLPAEAEFFLAALAATATVGTVAVGERLPAAFGAVATIGFVAGALTSGFVVTVAAALATFGGIGFVLTSGWFAFERVSGAVGE